jgi:hypothetical protein
MSLDKKPSEFSKFVKNRHLAEKISDKYRIFLIMIIFAVATYLMISFSGINSVILAGDLLFLASIILLVPEVNKTMKKKKEAQELLLHERPPNWLKSMILLFILSFLSGLCYAVIDIANIGIESNSVVGSLIGDLFIFCAFFFLFGLLFWGRTTLFVIDPSSKGNVLIGKVLKTGSYISIRIALGAIVVFLQVINGLMLKLFLALIFTPSAVNLFEFVYLPALVLSFIGVIPYLYRIIFRFNEKNRVQDWIFTFCYYSPWFVLLIYSLLMRAGI